MTFLLVFTITRFKVVQQGKFLFCNSTIKFISIERKLRRVLSELIATGFQKPIK